MSAFVGDKNLDPSTRVLIWRTTAN